MARPTEWKGRGVVNAKQLSASPPNARSPGRFLPDPPLDAFVEHFWTVAWDLRDQHPVTRETLPHPSVHLIVEEGRSGLAGVATERFTRVLEGRGRVLGVKFLPGCFRPFWHASVAGLTDRVVPLKEAFGRRGEELEAGVLACGDDEASAVAVAEALLTERAPARSPQAAQARRIVAKIKDDRTSMRAEEVAETAKMSLRALQRLFAEYVGVSPKWVINRYRLHEAMDRLEAGDDVDLAAIASELGYFDQAHFIKDFKAMVGRTPGAYAKNDR